MPAWSRRSRSGCPCLSSAFRCVLGATTSYTCSESPRPNLRGMASMGTRHASPSRLIAASYAIYLNEASCEAAAQLQPEAYAVIASYLELHRLNISGDVVSSWRIYLELLPTPRASRDPNNLGQKTFQPSRVATQLTSPPHPRDSRSRQPQCRVLDQWTPRQPQVSRPGCGCLR